MKQFISCLLTVIICIGLFTCCTANQSSLSSSSNTADAFVSGDLHLISPVEGVIGNEISGTENGFYRYCQNSKKANTTSLYYYDYATLKKAPLTSNINNFLSDDNNVLSNISFPLTDNNYLYLYKRGNYWLSDGGNNSNGLACFTRSSHSGENLVKVTLSCYEEPDYSSAILADNTCIYYISFDISPTDIYKNNTTLHKINFETGENTVLATFDAKYRTLIIGAFENNIVLKQAEFDKDFTVGESRNIINYNIKYYNIDTGSQSLITSYNPAEYQKVYYNNALYYLKSGTTQLCKYDIESKKDTVLFDKISLELGSFELQGIKLCTNVWDNKLQFVLNDADYNYKYIAYDLNTQVFYETKLTIISDPPDDTRPVNIFAECNDYFIVYNEDIEYEAELTGNDGVKYTDMVHDISYAAIKKQDFWNNNPVYTNFTDA